MLDDKHTHIIKFFTTVKVWIEKLLALVSLRQICTVTKNNKNITELSLKQTSSGNFTSLASVSRAVMTTDFCLGC